MLEREETRPHFARNGFKPRNCVWEITLACNLRCLHCGSRAGAPLPCELTTAECLNVVAQLHAAGCELLTLSGGEPTLRSDWDVIARAAASRGILVNMVTNGAFRDEASAREVAGRAAAAGLCNVGVSLDGPREVHDRLRGQGTFARALSAVAAFRTAGLPVTAMTTVNRINLARLPEVRAVAMHAGASMWRLQLGKPMGSMALRRDLMLRPRQLLRLIPLLAQLQQKGGIRIAVGDSIGYYGPYDDDLRGRGWRDRRECWQGCQAGLQAVGIEADGTVKGCLSLQARRGAADPFAEGNLRLRTLDDIWHAPGAFAYNRGAVQLTGDCEGCRYGAKCRGGARCVSAAVAGVLTEDPYCYYRLAERRRVRPQVPAQAAAVALALSLGSASCGARTDLRTPAGADAAADVAVTEVPIDVWSPGDAAADGDVAAEPNIANDYGVEPCPPNPCCGCDYGVPPPPQCCEGG